MFRLTTAVLLCSMTLGCDTPEGNRAAQADDGAVCLEENYDLVMHGGWTEPEVSRWCKISSKRHWGEMYIIDNCRRCNWECCTRNNDDD